MEIYKKLYLDEEIENKEEILQIISDGNSVYNLYLICIERKNENLFEILNSKEVFKDFNKDKKYILIGMAFRKEKAFSIVKQIFEEYIFLKKDINKIKLNFLRNK